MNRLSQFLRVILFLNKSWPVRIWMWSASGSMVYYLIKSLFLDNEPGDLTDTILMAYGMFSLAVYVLINGFNWS